MLLIQIFEKILKIKNKIKLTSKTSILHSWSNLSTWMGPIQPNKSVVVCHNSVQRHKTKTHQRPAHANRPTTTNELTIVLYSTAAGYLLRLGPSWSSSSSPPLSVLPPLLIRNYLSAGLVVCCCGERLGASRVQPLRVFLLIIYEYERPLYIVRARRCWPGGFKGLDIHVKSEQNSWRGLDRASIKMICFVWKMNDVASFELVYGQLCNWRKYNNIARDLFGSMP